MKTRNNRNGQSADFTFDVWVNNQLDFLSHIDDHDDISSFDDNWIVSAGDLFGRMDIPLDEPMNYHDEAA